MSAGILALAATTSQVNGTTSVSGTLSMTTATKTFVGAVTVNAGGVWTSSAAGTAVFRGGITHNGTTFTAGIAQFNTNNQALAGASAMTFAGAAVTITGTLNGTVAGSTFTNGANATLNYGAAAAPMATGVLNAGANPNAVNYNRAGAQTVRLPVGNTYHHLTLSGSGVKTLPAAALAINGNFTLAGTATTTAAGALTVGGNFTIGAGTTFNGATFSHSVAGNFSNSGTFTASTSTMTLNGAAAQTIGGAVATTFYRLTINNTSGGVTLSGVNATATNLLTFQSGIVTTGAQRLILAAPANCTTGVSRPGSGHVAGFLQMRVPVGNPTCTFHVGDATDYRGVTLSSFSSGVTTAGDLTVSVTQTAGDHPNIATSGLDDLGSVNRYWTISNSGLVIGLPGTYSATFNFIATDLDGGALPSTMEVERYLATWNTTGIGTRTATSTQATGINGFGDFAVARKKSVVSSFNGCSSGDTCPRTTAKLNTRLANGQFALYLAALKLDGSVATAFNGSATVSLVGTIASGGGVGADNCPTAALDLNQSLGLLAFTNGKRTQTAITVNNVYRDVRVKFVCTAVECPPLGITVCSNDNFAIRPDNFTITVPAAFVKTAGDTTVGDTFSLDAVAKGGGADVANYNGTPQTDASLAAATSSGPNNNGALTGSFGVAAGGVASGTFGYSEAGYFALGIGAVHDSGASRFTAADSFPAECTDDFNNTYTATDPAATVGCRFRNQAASGAIGRFTPDRFVLIGSPAVTPYCGSGATGFTYEGQAQLGLTFTLEARNKADVRTRNYDDTYLFGKGLVEPLAENNDNDVDLSGRLNHASSGWPVWSDGRFVVSKLGTFSRPGASPDGPYDSLEIGARVTKALGTDGDADGIKVSPENMTIGTKKGVKLPGTTRVRFGRLRLANASGSELYGLPVPMSAQYWNGTGFVTNGADACTTVTSGMITLGNYQRSLNAGETTPTVGGAFAAGVGSLMLSAPGAGNQGSVDLRVDLSGQPWLQGRWDAVDQGADGNLYDDDPSARATFGVFRDRVLYRRENY
ncbi:MAG: hypothetical protein HZC23_12735 [Rhodocyclales bacterium]|nr:hypothetical protein [Rhodocyclales bacterium]